MLDELEALYRSRFSEFCRVAAALAGYSFDRRVAAGTAVTPDGKHVPLIVRRFGGRVSATFFVSRGRMPRFVRAVVLRDAGGHVVFRWNRR